MRYVESRCRRIDREDAYRIYVAEALRGIAGMNVSYLDCIKEHPIETRSADEIISSVSDRLARLGGE